MYDRLHFKLAQSLDAVKYTLARVLVNWCRGKFRLADTNCGRHNEHRFRTKRICPLFVG